MSITNSVRTFLKGTLRTVDIPATVAEWIALLGNPVPLESPADFGLALAPYTQRSPFYVERSRLALLLDAYRIDGDPEAGSILSGLLQRWLAHCRANEHFDFMTSIPRSFVSGPPRDFEGLVNSSGSDFALTLNTSVWIRTAATGDATACDGAGGSPSDSRQARSGGLAAQRVLVVVLSVAHGADLSGMVHNLYARGAARVGILAICDEMEVYHG